MRLSLLLAAATLAALPAAAQTARLQVIHNAADPAASVVDVYVNNVRLLNDFAFRTATPFIDVPAGVGLDVRVAPGSSTGPGDAVFSSTYSLPAGSTTQLIAQGVLAPAGFAPNPDGRPTAFQLLVGGAAREASAGPGSVRVRVVHGASDAPTVDVRTGGAVLVDNAAYTDVTGYLDVPPASVRLGITTADGTPVAAFTADLSAAGGGAVTGLASGFLARAANPHGAAFGLLAVFPNGTTALLPAAGPSARLQIIHNAADPALALVDVYVNNVRLLDNFAFRSATPYIDVPADGLIAVAVAPSTSAGAGDAVVSNIYSLLDGETAQIIAQGVLTPAAFSPNPTGRPTGAELIANVNAREGVPDATQTFVRVVHGATDAPTIDVRSGFGGPILFDDASYGDVTRYLELGRSVFTLGVTTGSGAPVAAYTADLTTTGGLAVTVLASGFLAPAANQNGAAFGLLAVFPNGTTALLPVAVAAEAAPEAGRFALGAPAPNPLAAAGSVAFSLAVPGRATLALFDALGRRVALLADGDFAADRHTARLDTAGLAAGTYVLRLRTDAGTLARPLTVVR